MFALPEPYLAIAVAVGITIAAVAAWRTAFDDAGSRRDWVLWILLPIGAAFYFVGYVMVVSVAVVAIAFGGAEAGYWDEPEWLQDGETQTTTTTTTTETTTEKRCEPGYKGVCLDPDASDYDCGGEGGDGPKYVWEVIGVGKYDRFDLDRDGDGIGCENFAKGGSVDPNDLGEPPLDLDY